MKDLFDTSDDMMPFYILCGALVAILLMFLVREFQLWFLKINQVLKNQEEIKAMVKVLMPKDVEVVEKTENEMNK